MNPTDLGGENEHIWYCAQCGAKTDHRYLCESCGKDPRPTEASKNDD